MENERAFNLFRMTAAEIRTFDCGGLEHPGFPKQQQRRACKPTLREVVEAVEEAVLMNGSQPGFNIEIKSDPALYGTHQPSPPSSRGRCSRPSTRWASLIGASSNPSTPPR